jgi:hypothetical protein
MSSTCHEDTFLQWFILSLSDLIIADGEGKGRLPSSGFSRYAAIYSLRPYDLYLDYNTCLPRVRCDEIKNSREPQGNWVCFQEDQKGHFQSPHLNLHRQQINIPPYKKILKPSNPQPKPKSPK